MRERLWAGFYFSTASILLRGSVSLNFNFHSTDTPLRPPVRQALCWRQGYEDGWMRLSPRLLEPVRGTDACWVRPHRDVRGDLRLYRGRWDYSWVLPATAKGGSSIKVRPSLCPELTPSASILFAFRVKTSSSSLAPAGILARPCLPQPSLQPGGESGWKIWSISSEPQGAVCAFWILQMVGERTEIRRGLFW